MKLGVQGFPYFPYLSVVKHTSTKLAVLGSTKGTDLQAILNAISSGELKAEVAVVISNRQNAYILERAENHGVAVYFISHKGKTREKFDKEILPFTDIEKLFTVSILDSASLKLAKETIEIYKSISTEIKKHRNETKKLKKELDDYSKQAIFYEITGLSPNLDDFIELLSSKEITEHKDLSKYDEETIADYNLLISQARRARVGNNKSTLKVKQLRELQISYNVTIEIKLDEVVSVFNDLSKEVRSLDSTQTFPSQQLDIISKLNSLILFFHKEMDNFSIVVVN